MQDGGEALFLDGVGEVAVAVGRDGLSLQPLHPELVSSCWSSITLQPKLDSKIKFSDVYAIEMLDKGPIRGPWNTRCTDLSYMGSPEQENALRLGYLMNIFFVTKT
ncbi:hypothetical protein U9M48_022538 [Paspalum notatum var. saurae]|uniref:Uncharacterized protein n=1 Tax=Paspalum notatum var. saurae TaxID=547442 RepID=A0AAQ3TNA1_PASNO